jgi:hypothetical protein
VDQHSYMRDDRYKVHVHIMPMDNPRWMIRVYNADIVLTPPVLGNNRVYVIFPFLAFIKWRIVRFIKLITGIK